MSETSRLFKRFNEIAKSEGFTQVVARGMDKLSVYAQHPVKKLTYGKKTFKFDSHSFPYATYAYNATWRNERSIEVPILQEFLQQNQGKRVLEIGNVSRYYGNYTHDVIDKYEDSDDVLNIDVMDFQPSQKYDALLSISTFEHIGWDEPVRDPQKIIAAIDRCKSFVHDPKNILISVPLGYNQALDEGVKTGRIRFDKMIYMKRVNKENYWVETDRDEALRHQYGSKFAAANSALFGYGLSCL